MAQGSLSSADLVSFYIQRIEAFDKISLQLQSIAQLNPIALSEVIHLDKTFQRPGLMGPLHGMPVLLQDNIDTGDGMANTAGSHTLALNFPKDDAFLV